MNRTFFLVWVTAFWSHHRQITPKSYAGPDSLGKTLQLPAHSTAISSVLFLQWGPCLSRMFPDGYMKDKFPKPKNFLASYITPVSHPVPPTPANLPNAKQNSGEKKSQVLKMISFQEIWISLCPSLMSLSLKRSWWGLRNKIGDRFLSRRYEMLPKGVIYLVIMCSLPKTDLHTGQRKLAFWSLLKHK